MNLQSSEKLSAKTTKYSKNVDLCLVILAGLWYNGSDEAGTYFRLRNIMKVGIVQCLLMRQQKA